MRTATCHSLIQCLTKTNSQELRTILHGFTIGSAVTVFSVFSCTFPQHNHYRRPPPINFLQNCTPALPLPKATPHLPPRTRSPINKLETPRILSPPQQLPVLLIPKQNADHSSPFDGRRLLTRPAQWPQNFKCVNV